MNDAPTVQPEETSSENPPIEQNVNDDVQQIPPTPPLLTYTLIAVLFFLIGAIAGYVLSNNNNQALIEQTVNTALNELVAGSGQAAPQQQIEIPEMSELVDDDPSIGPEDAPIVMVEFSDFNCSFCKRFHDITLEPLLDQYEGQIRFVYRDYAILGDTSVTSAMAAECADEQGRFWDYHDLLFANQGNFSRDQLIEYADLLGLDIEQFTACYDDQTTLTDVRFDSTVAQDLGIGGTPGFIINGQFVSGAQPLDVFTQIIDEQLAQLDVE